MTLLLSFCITGGERAGTFYTRKTAPHLLPCTFGAHHHQHPRRRRRRPSYQRDEAIYETIFPPPSQPPPPSLDESRRFHSLGFSVGSPTIEPNGRMFRKEQILIK